MADNYENQKLEPTILVIFGLTGDLAQRKLLPALYGLMAGNILHNDSIIVGVSRRAVGVSEVLASLSEKHSEAYKTLSRMTKMHQMNLDESVDYGKLKKYLDGLEDQAGRHMNRLFYLSVPPQMSLPIITMLGANGLNSGCQHGEMSRLLVEKPFGVDLESAKSLISETNKYFSESQVYRIDHYIAKDSVQKIADFRFKNPELDKIWNGENISHIQITAVEKIGIENRVTFYEGTGALRDVIQSHLLQLLAILTMDRPGSMSADDIHSSVLDLLKSVETIGESEVERQAARGQYDDYRQEVQNTASLTETYAAVQLNIDNERWDGVPVLIRTGKALAEKLTEMNVVFKPSGDEKSLNVLRFGIQPERIVLDLPSGNAVSGHEVLKNWCDLNNKDLGTESPADAYERVLADAMHGDKTVFATSQAVLESWRIVDCVVRKWYSERQQLETYKTGSWGPSGADTLAESTGLGWLND